MNMKKTLISLATASLIASTAMAADKGVDIVTTGQAVIYYETNDSGTNTLFDQVGTQANTGLQLNLDSDLKNGFTFGSQLTYLGTAGLEKNLVSAARQDSTQSLQSDTTSQIMLSQLNIAKKIGNSTLKIGRQELPLSLSPFAFSEGWTVFKNSFDAILAINSDIPNTTLVGAYVSKGNTVNGTGFNVMSDLVVNSGAVTADGAAYMLTAQNTSLPMTTLTASYYDVAKLNAGALEGANIAWIDAKIADKDLPMGLAIGLQGGSIMTGSAALTDTTAYGAKVDLKPADALSLTLAYSSVDDGSAAMKNTAPGAALTPLYTQLAKNMNYIASDSNTVLLKAVYDTGDYGSITARGTVSTLGGTGTALKDATDLEFIYTIKAGGIKYLASYMTTSTKDHDGLTTDVNYVRIWARYNF